MNIFQEEVLIVSKTKMEVDVCIGGIGLTSKKNLRLLAKIHWTQLVPTQEELLKRLEDIRAANNVEGDKEKIIQEEKTSAKQWGDQQKDCNIGEVWLVSYNHIPRISNPHTEDIIVKKAELIKKFSNEELKSYILNSGVPIWEGGLDSVFDGLLQFTYNGSAYVSIPNSELLSHSVGFWLPNSDLSYIEEVNWGEIKTRYYYGLKRMAFVGFQVPLSVIQSGTLVRLSLPRPKSFESVEPRCYLQLSGWYD